MITAIVAGSCTTVATNAVETATSNAAILTVNPADSTPVFTQQPIGQTVLSGGSVTFTAAAIGGPAPTYQWQFNGVDMINTQNIGGATSASLTIARAIVVNGGSYTCVATNSVGSTISDAAILMVNPADSAPVFTQQPTGQKVLSGGSVTFTAAAIGEPAPTYQWQFNGVDMINTQNIGGATSASLTIARVTVVNGGSYTCVATNAAGSTTSDPAVLALVIPPSNAVVSITVE